METIKYAIHNALALYAVFTFFPYLFPNLVFPFTISTTITKHCSLLIPDTQGNPVKRSSLVTCEGSYGDDLWKPALGLYDDSIIRISLGKL